MIEEIKYKLNSNNSEKPSGCPQASVLIPILNYGKFIESPELIYTQRSSHLSKHSGEVSFPGGKADETDLNLFETALRESNEEMSLKSEDVTKLGKLKNKKSIEVTWSDLEEQLLNLKMSMDSENYSRGQQTVDFVERVRDYYYLLLAQNCSAS